MLHSLKVKNFFSFREEQEFSLSGVASTEDDRRFFNTQSGKNVAKVGMIYGANASGKTNFLKSMAFLTWFLANSWRRLEEKSEIPYDPFIFTKENQGPTEFEIISESLKGVVYRYKLIFTAKKVLHESLRMRNKGDTRAVFLFIRDEEVYKIYPRVDFSLKDVPKTVLRENASFVAAARQMNVTDFDDFFQSVFCVSVIQGSVDSSFMMERNIFKILENNQNGRLFVEKYLKEFDMGISRLEIKKKEVPDVVRKKINELLNSVVKDTNDVDFDIYNARIVHEIGGKEYSLQIEQESNGTQKMIPLLTWIFFTLSCGGILVYDEIEHALHPLLMEPLLDLFYDEEINPHGAQLICSCHATDSMNFLHKRQIYFASKNVNQESLLTRLSDIAGVRNDDNIMQKYLSGVYGGVPSL